MTDRLGVAAPATGTSLRLYCVSTCRTPRSGSYGSRVNGESHEGSDLDLGAARSCPGTVGWWLL